MCSNPQWPYQANPDSNSYSPPRLTFLVCPKGFHHMLMRPGTFQELIDWADGGYKVDFVLTPFNGGTIWVISPGPGCENDIEELRKELA